jgi:NAD(P)-dependent dehydrogenase (short-subunit alcohol dehydrogenase family)
MSDAPVMLIAGGTGSIGRAVAVAALAAGWRVALHGRTETSVAAACEGLDGEAQGFPADVTQAGTLEALVAAVGAWGGRIDAVVDCVSTGPKGLRLTGLFAETEPQGFAPFLDLSLAHLQRLAHAVLPWLAKQGGTLVAFASDAGRYAAPRQTIVGASRAGIIGFVRNLAVEVARDKVRVHCVSLSYVAGSATARKLAELAPDRLATAARRAGLGLPTPEDVAPLVLFLCGDGARRMTGQVLSVNGGLSA